MTTFNELWVDEINVNESAVLEYAGEFLQKLSKAWRVLEHVLLLKSITITDLTTLAGNDTISNVTMLVNKALCPLRAKILSTVFASAVDLIRQVQLINLTDSNLVTEGCERILRRTGYQLSYEDLVELKSLVKLLGLNGEDLSADLCSFLRLENDNLEDMMNLHVGAICVYPSMVEIVKNVQREKQMNRMTASNMTNEGCTKREKELLVPIATVAAGFPSGQYGIESKIKEIEFATGSGANEVDIVISRRLVIGECWEELFYEISALKQACGRATLKTILAVGECGSLENVYKASMVAMMAGSDYIKTSTGKESVNATIPVGIVMCRAIRNFYVKTGKKVGFKPAGGIKTADDALRWLKLIMTELGVEWLSHFRIGASSMLDNIEQRLEALSARSS